MRQSQRIIPVKFLIMKEDLGEAPLCIKILFVIRASPRAVAHGGRDALDMQGGKITQSSQFRLLVIII
jgi:hypothetical protein